MRAIIIGAGPSGLLAAYLLAQQGYQVTVLEKEDKIGGRLKADEFSDGSTLAVGATWIHNSEHPITNILGKGVDQRDLSSPILKETRVFVEIMHQTFMNILKDTKDLAERQEIADLTWPTLIKALENTENAAEATYISALKPHYKQYVQPLLQKMAKAYNKKHKLSPPSTIKTLIEQEDFFYSLDLDAMDDSVLADQHYLDSERLGSTEMIPQRGFQYLIQYLQEKIDKDHKDRVKILTNHQVLRVQESTNQMKILVNCQASHQTKILSVDKLIVAIAPNHYKTIKFSCEKLPEIERAIKYLHPSNSLKIAVLLDKSLNAANPIVCTVKVPVLLDTPLSNAEPIYQIVKIEFTPETENSKILVGFIHKDLFERLEKKDGVEKQLADILLTQDIRILETKRYYETGESWFTQKKGFLPVMSTPDSKTVYLGTVTGCCDAVHAILTNTCVQLGVNPKLLEKIFAAPQLCTQLAVR